jgi:hypothetical protein
MKKLTRKQREYISNLWFISDLKQSKPNLVLNYTEQNNNGYFTIGVYSFNSLNGVSHVYPLPNMQKLTFAEVEKLLK